MILAYPVSLCFSLALLCPPSCCWKAYLQLPDFLITSRECASRYEQLIWSADMSSRYEQLITRCGDDDGGVSGGKTIESSGVKKGLSLFHYARDFLTTHPTRSFNRLGVFQQTRSSARFKLGTGPVGIDFWSGFSGVILCGAVMWITLGALRVSYRRTGVSQQWFLYLSSCPHYTLWP